MNNNYTVSIVIPTYNHWSMTHALIQGLLSHEKDRITEIVVVDDGSQEVCEFDWGNLGVVKTYKMPKNVGFTLTANAGLEMCLKPPASRHLIFLISNDVQIKGKFIEQASDVLFGARAAFVGNKMFTHDTGWNTFNGKTFRYLEGAFLACTSDGWRDIGLLDPNYAPFDYEDMDVCTTAQSKGYKLVPLNNPNIIHQGGGTLGYTPERRAITERNREYFRKKWVK